MNKIFFYILFLSLTFSVKAQQFVDFTQKNHYKLFQNPAYSGFQSNLYATIAYRNQYTFLSKQATTSQFGEFSIPIFKKNYGVGIKLVNDFIAFQRYTLVEITGAYHLNVNKSNVSIGLGVGLVNLSLQGDKLRAPDGKYNGGLVIHNDLLIPNVNVGGVSPTFSFGILYSIKDFELGFAMQNINSPNISMQNNNTETNINIDRTINVHSSYVIKMTNVNVIPMYSFSTDFVKHQMQLGINAELNNIYIGLAFRGYSGLNNDALIAELGVKLLKKLRVGYSYDYNVSSLNKSNFGTHEISISYYLKQKFSTKSKGNVQFNPRFL